MQDTYLPRRIEARLRAMAGLFPCVVVGGARQVGKSTLLRHVLGDQAKTFVFDPTQDVGGARADPELFLRMNPPPLVLDEVQYAPELLAPLKRVVDERRGERGLYFLTGSQQLGVLRGVRESLAGRAGLLDLYPMDRHEIEQVPGPGLLSAMLESADLDTLHDRLLATPHAPMSGLLTRLFRGGYPGLRSFPDDALPDWFDSYLRTYLERDVPAIRGIDEPRDFGRFLRLIAALTASEVNDSQLGREIGVSPRTARAWLDVLSVSYQVLLLDPWSGNTLKRVSGRRKVHVMDTGLACHLLAISSPAALNGHRSIGSLVETWVVTELLKQAQGLAARPRFWHWRTSAGAEVDLLIERDGRFLPLEVKLKSRPTRLDARGLAAFASTYPDLRIGPRVIVHGGPDIQRLDEDTLAVPIECL